MLASLQPDAAANPADAAEACAPAAPAPSVLARCSDAAQTVVLSAALWTLYVPHYVVLRLLGPRWGMTWVRLAANVHWLLTFVGAQASARRALTSMRPYFDTHLSVSQILRRHLLLKHECFARVRVYSMHAANNPQSDVQWRCNPDCVDALPKGDRERGLIIVGYHFNFFQTFGAGLAKLFPGVDLVQLRYRSSRCVEKAASPITRLALKKAMEADRRAGATVFYIDDVEALVHLYRLLRKGGVVAVTADGGAAGDFVDVPFFDGTLRVPAGWAKLAAGTKSDILLICDKEIDPHTRDGLFFDHVRCTDASSDAAYAAAADSIRVLERMIREEPWGWHPWQRLRVDVGADGVRRYSLKQYGFDEGQRLEGKPLTKPNKPAKPAKSAAPSVSTPSTAISPRGLTSSKRPRVAVVANSFPPYRVHLHEQIVAQVPEVELWSLATHSNSYHRWKGLQPPDSIRPVEFGHGEPTNEQPQLQHSLREWLKGGRIIRWLRDHEIQAVFCQGCGDVGRMRILRWCQRRGIPCYLTGDFNIQSDNHHPLKSWLKYRVYNRGVGWAHGLMPCGQHGLALLHRYGGRGKPAMMFPFVPDVKLFEHTPPEAVERTRRQFDLRPERRRIVFSARMMRVKRPDLVVAAFAAIADERPEWDLVMIGDGPLRDAVEMSVPARLKDRVVWTGFHDDAAAVAGIYAQCDVMVLPSDAEPWGVVVVEAAAAGLAIVASDMVGAAPELVKEGVNGALFPAGDLAAFTNALKRVTSPSRIDEVKRQSRAVLHDWLAECDPVAAFGAALEQSGVIAKAPADDAGAPVADYSMRTAGVAALPV
ncbi:MAG: glycosyltransferase [Pirellulales bacterium]|nr:glycosyltransferase [Pirellulales bacterium]